MKYSLSYYIIILVLKLKGLKKIFSKDPIDYKRLRKEDVHKPSGNFFKKYSHSFKILDSTITEIKQVSHTGTLVIFIHGGGFVSGPGQHHWDTIKKLSDQTEHTIWLCNYPKAPEVKISEISKNIDAVFQSALTQYSAHNIILIGDSVGGTLIIALTQRLIKNNIGLPKKIILISPVMDATMTNPNIEKIDQTDPMLSKIGLRSAKKMCAKNNDLKDPKLSPIYESFDNFPKTILYLAENDITYPDQQLTVQKLKEAEVDVKVIIGKGMPHVWPLLPVFKEGKIALKTIIEELNK